MKKRFIILLSVIFLFGASACGSKESPETAVTNYLNAFNTLDTETISLYSSEEYTGELLNDESGSAALSKEMLQNMSFEILSSEEKGDTATVTVSITNTDAAIVLSEYVSSAFGLIFSGLSEEEMDAKMTELLAAAFENNKESTVTNEVTLSLSKENDQWKVLPDEEMLDAILGGMYSIAESMSNAFSE